MLLEGNLRQIPFSINGSAEKRESNVGDANEMKLTTGLGALYEKYVNFEALKMHTMSLQKPLTEKYIFSLLSD